MTVEMVELRNGTTITLAEYEKAKTERRRASAKQAAKTRAKNAAESEIRRAFLEKFEDCNFGGIMHAWVYPAMARSVKSGVLDPRLVERDREVKANVEKYDRKQAEFLARPITAQTEARYTGLIKNRQLYEGACELSWPMYFVFRKEHAGEVAPLTADDLAYAGLWTSCAIRP